MSGLWTAKFRVGIGNVANLNAAAVALRKALFNSSRGAAVSRITIRGIPHEFRALPGVREDAFEVTRNLCGIKFRVEGNGPATFDLDVKGPIRVTALALRPAPGVTILNDAHPIASVAPGGRLLLSGQVSVGCGYRPGSGNATPGEIRPDCNFTPVRKAACTVEGSALIVTVATDGRATPREALDQALSAMGAQVNRIEEAGPPAFAPASAPAPADGPRPDAPIPLPSLTGMHRRAFEKFVSSDLVALVAAGFPIRATDGSAEIDLTSVRTEPPAGTADECLDQAKTYSGTLGITLTVRDRQGQRVREQEVSLGEIPWLTERETFVVKGVEKAVWPVVDVTPEHEDAELARLPVRLLRAFTDSLRPRLSSAGGILAELLARPGPDGFDLSLVADHMPVGRLLAESLWTHPCSRAMDDTNPLSRLSEVRRVTALGPGNLDSRAGIGVRSLQPSHYGRLCSVETPEGPNIGLVNALALFAELGEDGLLRTPYIKMSAGVATGEIVKLTADEEAEALIRAATATPGEPDAPVRVRRGREFLTVPAREVEYAEVSPIQPFGASASLTPFLCHDDASRLLMGANMQRQATPLIHAEAPLVCSGTERAIADASGAVLRARRSGRVESAAEDVIRIRTAAGETDEYRLRKFRPTNAGTWMNQRALVAGGDTVETGQAIAEECGCDRGCLALGANVLAAFLPWEGYNFEDAIVVSDRMVREDVLTSLRVVRLSARARAAHGESIGRRDACSATLDGRGIVREGACVAPGDILVCRTAGTGGEARDVSLRVPPNVTGRVTRVMHRSVSAGDVLAPGVTEAVDVEIVVKRKAEVGDKLSNRHGAKGIIGAVVPVADMPHLPDGTPIDVLVNPLGVPTRMNVGQVLELHMGWAAGAMARQIVCPPVQGEAVARIEAALTQAGLPRSGTSVVFDGRNGRPFHNEVSVGYLYVHKLNHLAADKMRARGVGPYSLLTQQPTADATHSGGQMFGEMEVWAATAHGAHAVLREMLTVKSDDAGGRARLVEAVANGGAALTSAAHPQSMESLVALLRGAALDAELPDAGHADAGLRVALASPDVVRSWSSGEVTSGRLTDGSRPAAGGLFCPEIFGPNAMAAAVEDTARLESAAGREGWMPSDRMGHVELAMPVCHPWILHEAPDVLCALARVDRTSLEDLVYCRKNAVQLPDGVRQVLAPNAVRALLRAEPRARDIGTGGAALKRMLRGADGAAVEAMPESETRNLLGAFLRSGGSPEWMVIEVLPVVSPACRPLVRMPSDEWLSDDLNELYGRVIARNQACRQAIEQSAPEVIVRETARGLQEAVEMLMGNGAPSRAQAGAEGERAAPALSDRIAGGRGSLLTIGKRVDFSGRAVIAPGPGLQLTQCGLPAAMARELFKPFLARQLVRNGSAHDAAEADAMIDRGQADGLLPEAVRGRVVLLNRAPTMDRYYLQAFEPVLTDHNAILLHPLMCRGFNADFDGDQMAVHLPVSDAAQAEARRLMTPLSHLVQSRPSETVIAFDQEIVYGLHYLTAEKTGAKESEKEFTDAAAALSAFEAGRVGLHERIRAARGRETLLTTPGRIVFNAAFPAGLDFVNGMMDRKKLRQLMHDLYTTHGPQVVAGTLDVLQRLGFQYATESGLSIGKDFLRPYTGKPEAMARLREREAAIDRARQEGRLSEDAARHEWTQLWINTTHEIGGSLMREMASDAGGFNPVHRMHVSGSRGSAPQLRQLNGIRGLMINGPRPDGRLTPVEASFIEGLSTWDCFVSGYGSRRGLLDVALKIADAGQLQKKFTLRLADVRITCEDCGTARSQALSPFKDGDCVIEDVAERAVGRIAAEDVSDPESGMRIVAAGGLIDRAAAERIRASGAAGVRIRDIAGCEAADGVCARCYGADVATGQLPAIGSPVGLIAAHAMGEPTSQLTLQAFWGWRKRSDGSWNDGYRVEGGIPRLAALERSGAEVEPEERVRAMTAIFREQWVSVPDKHFELLARAMRGHWRSGWLARAARPRPDETTTGILIRAALACEIDSLAGTVQRVLAGRL